MKLAIIAMGGIKEKYFGDACAEYGKRMAIMRPVEVIELKEEPISDERTASLVEAALAQESRRILERLRPEDMTAALTPEGKMMDSVSFARTIDPSANPGCKRMVYIIGSSHGLGQAVYERCHLKLSFGPMTFPHQLVRVMLLEQLYRGQMILSARQYHK